MFGISFEHLLIVGIILIFVGPRRLPELGNTLGKAIKNFKDSFAGIEEANFKRMNAAITPVPMVKDPAPAPALAESAAKVPDTSGPFIKS